MTRWTRTALFALGIAAAAAGPAVAQPKVEIGSSLAGAVIGIGDDNDVSTFGIPSAGFGLVTPGVYASLFLGSHFALEPQIGLIWISSDGESDHVLNFSGQANYYFRGLDVPSLYVFAAGGILDSSGDGDSPKTVGGGLGVRMPVGDRLTFRLDGRYLHLTDDGGDQVAFTLSIGGVFGR
jgi:hypothetical protein